MSFYWLAGHMEYTVCVITLARPGPAGHMEFMVSLSCLPGARPSFLGSDLEGVNDLAISHIWEFLLIVLLLLGNGPKGDEVL